MRPPAGTGEVDRLFGELLRTGDDPDALQHLLSRPEPDETTLLAVLRRAVPIAFLEHLGTSAPWISRPRVLGGVARNPRTPRALALRLLPALFWRDLADVAASPRLSIAIRSRAEGHLKEMLPDMRLGARVTLAKLATPAVLIPLLADPEPRVVSGALTNPRLREDDLLSALRGRTVSPVLIAEAASSFRWKEAYGVRLELALQPRTPLAIALGQLSSLVTRDLGRVASTEGLVPLLQAAASRVAEDRGKP